MKICVYGAASDKIEKKFKDLTFEMAYEMAKRGHTLVFGAGGQGLMGAAARGFDQAGATMHGVIPTFFKEFGYEAEYKGIDKITYTKTMAERKTIMEDDCDAFVIVPGGIGTMEEFFQILTLKQLGRHKKAIAVFNMFGYYDSLDALIKEFIAKEFVNEECLDLYKMMQDKDEVISYVENYSPDNIKWNRLKNDD